MQKWKEYEEEYWGYICTYKLFWNPRSIFKCSLWQCVHSSLSVRWHIRKNCWSVLSCLATHQYHTSFEWYDVDHLDRYNDFLAPILSDAQKTLFWISKFKMANADLLPHHDILVQLCCLRDHQWFPERNQTRLLHLDYKGQRG